jgi:hypothetical protein
MTSSIEILFTKYYKDHQIKEAEMAGHVAYMGKMRNVYIVLVGKPEGMRPLRRPGCRWEHNIKLSLPEIGLGEVDLIHLAQDRDWWWAHVNTVMNLRVP